MLFRLKLLLTIFILSTALIGCSGGKMEEKQVQYSSIKDTPNSAWEKLAQKKIYFGHQSVGNNIFEGIRDLMKENPQIKLNIIETSNSSDFKKPLFAHSPIGQNDNPVSKIDAFGDFMKKGIGNKADVAFFKLCFADIEGTTDVNMVFNAYKKTMSHLKKQYPETTFVHVTVPLLSDKKTLKTWIKRIIGKKDNWGYDGNIKRNDFNELLRKEYEGKHLLFDLAKIESTFSDGTMASFIEDGNKYYYLIPEYTHDGGHLNQTGRKIVAEQLLLFLSDL